MGGAGTQIYQLVSVRANPQFSTYTYTIIILEVYTVTISNHAAFSSEATVLLTFQRQQVYSFTKVSDTL